MDESQLDRVSKERSVWFGPLIAMLVCGLIASLFLGTMWQDASDQTNDLVDPLPIASPRCRVNEERALARAQALEGLGDASWERLPFDQHEAPQAVLRMAESESCYRVSGEREGAQRASLKRRTFENDLRRRWSRTKLMLELARRRGDAGALRRQIAALLALSNQGGTAAVRYRDMLQKLDRAAEALLLEAKAKED
jgi:hypothetical protein